MSGRSRSIKVEILGDASGLDKAFQNVSGSAGGLATKLGKTAALGVAALGTLAVGAGAAAFKVGESFDEAYDTIETGTGASGEALEELKGSFKNVLTDVPTDFGTASAAIADLNTALGLTGEPLEELAGQFINLGRITGEDVPGLISKGTRAFGDWSIATEDQGEALDFLFKTSQSTGVGVQDLMGKVVQFGAPMRQFGFSFEETAALMGRFEKEGVNTELVMGSLRIAGGKFAKENIPLREGLEDTIARIQEMGPSAESTALAMEVFGARAGVDMVDTILNGKFAIEDLMGTLEASETTINGTADSTADFGEKFTLLKNKAAVAFEPIATGAFTLAGALLDKAVPAMDRLSAIVEQRVIPVLRGMGDWFLTVGLPAIQDFATQAQAFFTDVLLPAVTRFVDFLIPKLLALSDWFLNVGLPAIRQFAETATAFFNDQIRPAIEGAVDAVLPKIQQLSDFLQGHGRETMVAFAGAVLGVVVPALILWASTAGAAAVATIAALLPVLAPIALLAAAGAGLALAWETNFFGIRDKTKEVIDQLTVFFNDELMPTLVVLRDFVITVFTAIKDFVERNQEELRAILEAVWSQIQLVVESAVKIVRDVIQLAMSLIRGDWDQAWNEIKQIAETAKELIIGTVTNLKDTALAVFEILKNEAWPKFKELHELAAEQLLNLGEWLLTEGGPMLVRALVEGLIDLAPKALEAFLAVKAAADEAMANAAEWLVEAGKNIIVGLIEGIRSKIPDLTGVLDGVTDMIPDLKGPPERDRKLLYGSGQMIIGGLVQGIEDSIDRLIKALKKFTDTIISTLEQELIIPGPHESEEGYEVGKAVGTGVAMGLDDSAPEVYESGQELGRAAVEGTETGMAHGAGLNANAPPRRVGGALGRDMGEGVAEGAEEAAHSPGYASRFYDAGQIAANATQKGWEDDWDGYDAMKWFNPDTVVPPGGGGDPGDTPSESSPPPLPASNGGGGSVGVGTGSGLQPDSLYYFDTDGVLLGFTNASQTPALAAEWLARGIEMGVVSVRYSGGPLAQKGTYSAVKMLGLLQAWGGGAEASSTGAGPGSLASLPAGPGSNGAGPGGTTGGPNIQINIEAKSTNPLEIAAEVEAAMRYAALDPSLALVRS